MAISSFFQAEIDEVDDTKTLTFIVDTDTYELFEFSYNGLEITGGSDLGCEYGAAELMEEMGFRWYAPDTGASGNNGHFTKRPVSIPTNLTQAKTSYWIENNRIFLVYGHSWYDVHIASRDLLNDAMEKWSTLNSWWTAAYPVGHRWTGIISANLAYFQANPDLIIGGNPSAAGARFDLTVTGADYDNIVEICAAQILKEGLNEWNAAHFDPTDGDQHTSEQIALFTKAVGDKVRAGTAAIGTHPSRAGVANAEIGIYAYAGHRLPPTTSISPHYVGVALGFNNTSLSYQGLVEGWGAKASKVLIREYLDTQVWSDGHPLVNVRAKEGYFDRYDAFVAAGAIGTISEFAANWLVNIVQTRYGIRKFKTGTYTHDEALDDVMADIFDDDPAVRSLYEYWGDPGNTFHKWGLRQSFDYVDDMVASWYKTYFQQLCVILYEDIYMPPQNPGSEGDPFPAAFSSMMSKIVAVRDHDITHSYAWVRQKANTAVNAYPAIKWNATPLPEWYTLPVAPTEAEFNTYHTAIVADTVRDSDLDSADLVLVHGITPRVAATAPASRFLTIGPATYKFVGPGSVTITPAGANGAIVPGGEVVTEDYAAGIHTISVTGSYLCTHEGGYLFLDSFPLVRKDPDGEFNAHWLYIPTRMAGIVDIESDVRLRVVDQSGTINIIPVGSVGYVSPANLGTGQIKIDNTNTRGTFYNLSANRYISMHPTIALLPREIAEEDFPVRSVVNVT